MKEAELNKLLKDKNFLEERIKAHIKKKTLIKSSSTGEIKGHMAKAEHNLEFLNEIKSKYNDWAFVVCYYASYQAALALMLTKGYSSKSHDATLCILVKYFYSRELSEADIKLLNSFDAADILFYVQSKEKREKASYSTMIIFDQKELNEIKIKTTLFVNRAKSILDESR